jgi:hypothetical protein
MIDERRAFWRELPLCKRSPDEDAAELGWALEESKAHWERWADAPEANEALKECKIKLGWLKVAM